MCAMPLPHIRDGRAPEVEHLLSRGHPKSFLPIPSAGSASSRPGAIAGAALCSALCLALACAVADAATLTSDPTDLPFQFVELCPRGTRALDERIADLDGDSVDEVVTARAFNDGQGYYLCLNRVDPTAWTALRQLNSPYIIRLAGIADVDSGDTPEIFQVGLRPDGVLSVDVLGVGVRGNSADCTLRGSFEIDVSEWLWKENVWNGSFATHLPIDEDGDGLHETIVFSISGGMSERPRGIGVADWTSGETRWFLPVGAAPTHILEFEDLTGNGILDIVFAMGAPCNVVFEKNSVDTLSYVAAATLTGELLWIREVGGPSSGPCFTVADVDGDGTAEVLTGLQHGRETVSDYHALSLWNGRDGEPLANWSNGHPVNSVAVLSSEEGGRIFAAMGDGVLRSFRLVRGELEIVREMDCGSAVVSLSVVSPDPLESKSLIAATSDGLFVLFDADLRPLALFDSEVPGRGGKSGRDMRFAVGGRGILARTEDALFCLGLTRTPLDPWPIVLLGLCGLVCGAACVPSVRRTSLASLRRALTPPSDRAEAADELLDGLTTAGHGKLAVTSTLRRLCKQTAMSSGLEGPAPAELQERWRSAVRDALEVGVTSLDGVVLMARKMGLAPSIVARLRADLDRARKLLRSVPEHVPTGADASGLSERLEPLLESLENHLAELKASARRYVSAELVAELRRVMEAHRSDMLSAGIELQAPAVTNVEGVRVYGTRLEVCFVMDNLLSNAIEAVRNAAVRRIELSVCRDGDMVSVRVSDSGVGIPEELRDDVFKVGVSSRPGGGHGLPRSRELLKKRGGDIVLVRSTVGEGTEFAVRFEVV